MAQQRILTADRRLRVLVSSSDAPRALPGACCGTEAMASLHLTPALFEQGARPHAPRDLYSADVRQCDVFVGVYWQSYGWVAPGSEISRIENELELDLARGKPMLLYIKEPAPEREAALRGLIGRIEAEIGAAYRTFATADDLRALVTERPRARAHRALPRGH